MSANSEPGFDDCANDENERLIGADSVWNPRWQQVSSIGFYQSLATEQLADN